MSQPVEKAHVVCRGRKFVVEFAVLDDRSMPAKTYMDSLDPSDRVNLVAYMKHLADNGIIHNQPKKFKLERFPFWSFKRKGKGRRKIRIPCYQQDLRWILTHGFDKPARSEWDEQEFTTATAIRNEQLTRERKQQKKD